MDDRIDAVLTDPAGDQLRVLRTEIENEDDLLGLHRRILQGWREAPRSPFRTARVLWPGRSVSFVGLPGRGSAGEVEEREEGAPASAN
jgi:hypothetical protein